MRSRCGITKCANPAGIKYYIDKSITICSEWDSFQCFADWALRSGYTDELTIDRIDSDKGYGPDNCRWVSMAENLRSRRDRKFTMEVAREIRRRVAAGEKQARLSEEYGVTTGTISRRVNQIRWNEDLR